MNSFSVRPFVYLSSCRFPSPYSMVEWVEPFSFVFYFFPPSTPRLWSLLVSVSFLVFVGLVFGLVFAV